MMWCPNCEVEYRDGFTICADCGAKLKNISDTEFIKPTENDFPYNFVKLIFLIPSPYVLLFLCLWFEKSIFLIVFIVLIIAYFIATFEKKRFMIAMREYLGENSVSLCNAIDDAIRFKGRNRAFYRIDENIIDEIDLRKPKARNSIYYAKRFIEYGWLGVYLMCFIAFINMVLYFISS